MGQDESADGSAGGEGTGRIAELEQYETILQKVPDPIFVTDASGYLTFANRAFTEQFGYTVGTEGAVHVSEFIVDEDVDTILEILREMVTSDAEAVESRGVELEGVTGNGRTVALGGSITLLPSGDDFGGVAAVLRDVTARTRREEVFTVMDRALRHNLRTNVTTITMSAMGLKDQVDDDHGETLERIHDAAMWIQKLGDTLRRLQKAIDESFEASEAASVERIVDSAVRNARRDNGPADVTVNVSADGEIKAGSPIEYAVSEIVENAIVHNDTERPTVDVWVAHAPRDGWIDVHVEDDGPGIPTFERDVVLGDATIDQLQHGSGIGLWITRWVVEVYDGELDIEENDPRGTVVTLRLPLAGDASA
jgi:PAS domain S-box-containing protein